MVLWIRCNKHQFDLDMPFLRGERTISRASTSVRGDSKDINTTQQ